MKIIAKSGRIYEVNKEKVFYETNNGFFCVISYSHYDPYYSGNHKYRNQSVKLEIAVSAIESIDYRETNNETD